MKITNLINKLEELREKHGEKEVNIYHSFDEKYERIDEGDISYDIGADNIYIGIYS